MIRLNSEKWNIINEMIYTLNAESNVTKLRVSFLEMINALIPHDRSFFDLGYKVNTKVVFFDPVSRNMAKESLDSYYSEYEFVDTMFWFFSQEQNDIYRETDFINEAMQNTSVFYSEWLEPQNIRYSMGSKITYNGILYGSVNLWRSTEHGDFSDEEVQILSILNRHLSLRFFTQFPNGIRQNKDNNYSNTVSELYHLTPREVDIITLIYEGNTIKEISEKLYISENTVKKHTHNVFLKMKVSNRLQLIKIIHDHASEFLD